MLLGPTHPPPRPDDTEGKKKRTWLITLCPAVSLPPSPLSVVHAIIPRTTLSSSSRHIFLAIFPTTHHALVHHPQVRPRGPFPSSPLPSSALTSLHSGPGRVLERCKRHAPPRRPRPPPSHVSKDLHRAQPGSNHRRQPRRAPQVAPNSPPPTPARVTCICRPHHDSTRRPFFRRYPQAGTSGDSVSRVQQAQTKGERIGYLQSAAWCDGSEVGMRCSSVLLQRANHTGPPYARPSSSHQHPYYVHTCPLSCLPPPVHVTDTPPVRPPPTLPPLCQAQPRRRLQVSRGPTYHLVAVPHVAVQAQGVERHPERGQRRSPQPQAPQRRARDRQQPSQPHLPSPPVLRHFRPAKARPHARGS